MKRIDIVFGASLKEVHGINYVTNAFVQGKKFFEMEGLYLQNIYTPEESFDCQKHDSLLIGSNTGSVMYKSNRKLRLFFKRLLSSEVLLFAWLKFYLNAIRPAKNTVHRLLKDHDGDFLIFQDSITAYYYYKNKSVEHKKSILILHCSEDPYAQLRLIFPAIFRHTRSRKIFEGMHDFASDCVDKVVYLSNRAACAGKQDDDHKTYIFNGINDLPVVVRREVADVVNFVCVGSINYHKGQDVLIEAIAKLPDDIRERINMYFVGGGPQEAELKQRVDTCRLGKAIHFMGVRNDVAQILQTMDVFIMPSLSEGMPISIIEAMRQGLYIITTDTGGCAEMISEDFGRLTTRNVDELKSVIEDVLKNKRCSTESQMASRCHYEQYFTLQGMIANYSRTLLSI